MKTVLFLIRRAMAIALFFGSVGILSNLLADQPVQWLYSPPQEIVLAGIKVQIIDVAQARSYFDDLGTVFIDSRNCPDYAKSHVKGAICLPPDDIEQRFPIVETLIPLDSRVVLYCYGPECDMAEKVGTFLGQMGYKNLMIMSSGFRAWDKAKYPVEDSSSKNSGPSDFPGSFEEDEFLAAVGAQVFC